MKFWYDKLEDRILAIKHLDHINPHATQDGPAHVWNCADRHWRFLTMDDEYVKETLEETQKVRRAYLDQQIDKLERLKVSDPEIIEF